MAEDAGTSPLIPENPNRAEAQRALDEKKARDAKEAHSGAEGGADSDAADTPPGLPADHDAELGSTDQHSDA